MYTLLMHFVLLAYQDTITPYTLNLHFLANVFCKDLNRNRE